MARRRARLLSPERWTQTPTVVSAPDGLEVETVPHINLTTPIDNTACVVLRIWEDDRGSPLLQVRIEAWAWAGAKAASP